MLVLHKTLDPEVNSQVFSLYKPNNVMTTDFFVREQESSDIASVMLISCLIKIKQIKGNASTTRLGEHCQ